MEAGLRQDNRRTTASAADRSAEQSSGGLGSRGVKPQAHGRTPRPAKSLRSIATVDAGGAASVCQ